MPPNQHESTPTSPAERGRPLRLGVLISGSGSTLENLIQRVESGELHGVELGLVISSRGAVRGVSVARQAGLPTVIIRKCDYAGPAPFSVAIAAALDQAGVDLVVLAGFLCHWNLPQRYIGRTLNIHPALLPDFGGQGMYGGHVHAAVLAAGATETGCTVHLVDQQYDHGPIVAQTRVPVEPDDTPETLADRVQQAERDLYPLVIQQVADDGLGWLAGFATG